MDTLRKLFRRKTKIQEASDDVLRKKIRELQFIASRCPGKFNKIARGTLQPENEMARQEAHLTLFIINLNEVSRVYLSGLSKKELRGLYMREVEICQKVIVLENGRYVIVSPIKGMTVEEFLRKTGLAYH